MKDAQWQVEKALNAKLPVLLYQGQFDGQDGVASSTKWISTLKWPHHSDFESTKKQTVQFQGRNALLVRRFAELSHVVVRGAGHMVPHDQPEASQFMLENWIELVLAPPAQIETR